MDWPGESLRKTASASLASRSFPRQAWIPAGIRCAPLRILDIFRIADHRPITNATRKRNVSYRDGDKVATSQLAVDGEIKQRQIAFRTRHLQSRPDAPDLSRLKRRLLANNVAPVPARQGPSPMPPSTAAAPNTSSRIVAPLEPSITFNRLLISARDKHRNRRSRANCNHSGEIAWASTFGSEADLASAIPARNWRSVLRYSLVPSNQSGDGLMRLA